MIMLYKKTYYICVCNMIIVVLLIYNLVAKNVKC